MHSFLHSAVPVYEFISSLFQIERVYVYQFIYLIILSTDDELRKLKGGPHSPSDGWERRSRGIWCLRRILASQLLGTKTKEKRIWFTFIGVLKSFKIAIGVPAVFFSLLNSLKT